MKSGFGIRHCHVISATTQARKGSSVKKRMKSMQSRNRVPAESVLLREL
jgi:hypothetical protein